MQASPTDQLDDCVRGPLAGVEVGVSGGVLHLHVDEHPGAHVEHLVEGRDPRSRGADRTELVLGEDAEAPDLGVVVDDERPVEAAVHVELDPVGPLLPGLDERVECVLDRVTRRTPVAQDERAGCGSGHGRSA